MILKLEFEAEYPYGCLVFYTDLPDLLAPVIEQLRQMVITWRGISFAFALHVSCLPNFYRVILGKSISHFCRTITNISKCPG